MNLTMFHRTRGSIGNHGCIFIAFNYWLIGSRTVSTEFIANLQGASSQVAKLLRRKIKRNETKRNETEETRINYCEFYLTSFSSYNHFYNWRERANLYFRANCLKLLLLFRFLIFKNSEATSSKATHHRKQFYLKLSRFFYYTKRIRS